MTFYWHFNTAPEGKCFQLSTPTTDMPSPWCVSCVCDTRLTRGAQGQDGDFGEFTIWSHFGHWTTHRLMAKCNGTDLRPRIRRRKRTCGVLKWSFVGINPGSQNGGGSNVENGWKTLGVQLLQQWFFWYQLYQLYQPYIRMVKGGAVFNQICLMAQKISAPTWPPHHLTPTPNEKVQMPQPQNFGVANILIPFESTKVKSDDGKPFIIRYKEKVPKKKVTLKGKGT